MTTMSRSHLRVNGHGGLKSGAVFDYCGVDHVDGGLTVTVSHYLPIVFHTANSYIWRTVSVDPGGKLLCS